MDLLLAGLNEKQRQAVTSPATILQVLAPPGSGKTKTLTSRVAYLIHHDKERPRDIIVCTFTRKAAKEMEDRIRSFIGEDLQKRLILGTFHSICNRYLHIYGQRIGLPQDFQILEDKDTTAIIQRLLKKHDFKFEPGSIKGRISRRKTNCLKSSPGSNSSKSKSVDAQEFDTFFDMYEQQLEQRKGLDYDDLLLKGLQLFEQHPEVIAHVRAVLIDEFQDTNEVQYELMNRISCKRDGSTARISIVGDPDQSIYGWRNAKPENLDAMQKRYNNTHVVHLEENYRSSGAIIIAADKVIEQDTARPAKSMQRTRDYGHLPLLRKHPHAQREVSWLVDEIIRLHNMSAGLLNYGDFAILLRTNQAASKLETPLANHGIPYRVVGGVNFFQRKEISILLDYLRVIVNPSHMEALLRVINLPSRGIGEGTIVKLQQAIDQQPQDQKRKNFWETLLELRKGNSPLAPKLKLSRSVEKGLDQFVDVILSLQRKLESLTDEFDTLEKLIEALVETIGFREYLPKLLTKTDAARTKSKDDEEDEKDELQMRKSNIEELKAQARMVLTASYDESQNEQQLPVVDGVEQRIGKGPRSALLAWLGNIALATGVDENDNRPCLTISTIHKAKGLEWPIVFIPRANDGYIPLSTRKGQDVDIEEERRLLYVAMTRAKALLYISWSVHEDAKEELAFEDSLNREASRKVSQFLKPSDVQTRFSKTGPIINDSFVKGIANIIGRECPSESDMYDTFLRVNQCDVKAEYNDFEDPDRNGNGREAPNRVSGLDWYNKQENPYQRARQFNKPSFKTAQMTNLFTTGTTMAGFSTAAEMLRNEKIAPAHEERRESKKPSKAKSKPMASGQRGLGAFGFGPKTQPTPSIEDRKSDKAESTPSSDVPSPPLTTSFANVRHLVKASTHLNQTESIGKENIIIREHMFKTRIRSQPINNRKRAYEDDTEEKHPILSSPSSSKQMDEAETDGPNEAATNELVSTIDQHMSQTQYSVHSLHSQRPFSGVVSSRVFHTTTMDTIAANKAGTGPKVKRYRLGMTRR
jgi:DNA helicase II / ATP-dependent DNA helicase PcrA